MLETGHPEYLAVTLEENSLEIISISAPEKCLAHVLTNPL